MTLFLPFILHIFILNAVSGYLEQLNRFHGFSSFDCTQRTSRSGSSTTLTLPYFKEQLILRLRRQRAPFTRNAKIVSVYHNSTQSSSAPNIQILRGQLINDKSSIASISIDHNRLFTGVVYTKNESFYVEPSNWHIPHSHNFSMIIYKESDLNNLAVGRDRLSAGLYGDMLYPDGYTREDSHREKRSSNMWDPLKNTCTLQLVVDFKFFSKVGLMNEQTTVYYLTSLVDRVDIIFRDTVWSDEPNNEIRNIGFEIKQIEIYREYTRTFDGHQHFNMKKFDWEHKQLLEAFGVHDHSKFCLAHLFTYQDFDKGVMGMAYIGNPLRFQSGGICSHHGRDVYQNTGITSVLNWNRLVLTREADLVTGHELGHNFGAEHDTDRRGLPQCTPSKKDGGPYIMHATAVSGLLPNNKVFSPCSRKNITRCLRQRASLCFTEQQTTKCGNMRLDDGEECDEGLESSFFDMKGRCCDDNCKLLPHAACSDANHPCCMNCQIVNASKVCFHARESTCFLETMCDGKSANCRSPEQKPNGYSCIENGRCRDGVCEPLCKSQGYQSCICDEEENTCKQCCKTDNSSECQPYADIININDTTKYIYPKGVPCVQGFCSGINGICVRTLETNDIVYRILSLLTYYDSFSAVDILKRNIVVGVVLITSLFFVPICLLVHFCIDRKIINKNRKTVERIRNHIIERFRSPAERQLKGLPIKGMDRVRDLNTVPKSPDIVDDEDHPPFFNLASAPQKMDSKC